MPEEIKVGVYVCHCGGNISDVVNVGEVAAYASGLEGVAVARDYIFMCSNPGQGLIEKHIRQGRINRVVVACCSPRLHEATFRKALARAGLNPYLLEIANIREQCSWAHPDNPYRATEKAKDLVRMAVAKVKLAKPLENVRVPARPEVLVVGGGVAGLRAGLDLAERGFQVHIIEQSPFFGGRMAQLARVYPTEEEAPALLKKLFQKVAGHPRIRLYPATTLEEVEGFVGNWEVKIKQRPSLVDEKCDRCGRCEEVCPVEVPDPFNYGLSSRKAIYFPYRDAFPSRYAIDLDHCTRCGECVKACPRGLIKLDREEQTYSLSVGAIILATGFAPYEPKEGEYGYKVFPEVITLPQLVRLLSSSGPTRGELRLPRAPNTAQIKSVVFINCVGSRQLPKEGEKVNKYCSRYCCTAALQTAREVKRRYPETRIFVAYQDIRTYCRDCEDYYEGASNDGVVFLRYLPKEPPVVKRENGRLVVEVKDQLTFGETVTVPADLVVLVVGMEPSEGTKEMAAKLRLPVGEDGFLLEVHPKLRPVEVGVEGLFVAGTAQGPKDITETTLSASAAAVRASVLLARGQVELEPFVAEVYPERCNGCGICVEECSYGALKLKDGKVEVNEAVCQGCGACAAMCPQRALGVRGYTIDQFAAMIDAAVEEGVR
ncbi:4Fe-4S ferredoxin iron-sulfur binding domain protein [Ammonifex degensii KC4]|uniref:4Fe-4S ferredoxin iron-sulfur binding domain protein n=1 Tax=Ammonifex degensii (strain DSM 10501 / KC4) TaxID=429009 RepID=C9RCR8_AMMDK|nr:CoB--CoM heterodisulfide reductase iron-sulfur subunit A family protein [Ammonifex degensii]ACX52045.1 4Fe-4S ferredoxin iron-sulfur binding domain protein [Ammonifex degensii KC4]